MSIHVLTQDPNMTRQLTQLLAGGQQPFHFHDDLEALIQMLPKLKKSDKVFYDLQLEASLMAFDALRFGSKKTNLIAFEFLENGANSNCPASAKHYFLLSSDMRKTGARLKQVLHEVDALAVKKRASKKKAATRITRSEASTTEASAPPLTLSRYLTAKSRAMQHVLVQIAEIATKPQFVFITG